MVAFANSSEGIALAQALLNVYLDFDQWTGKTKESFTQDLLVNAVTLQAPYGGSSGDDLENCLNEARTFFAASSLVSWMGGFGTAVSCFGASAWFTGGMSLGPCSFAGFSAGAFAQAQALLTYSRDKEECKQRFGGGGSGDDEDIHPEHVNRR